MSETYTRTDMARAWREGRTTRPLFDEKLLANPAEPNPYAEFPDWCCYCMLPLDISADATTSQPEPCEADRLHCREWQCLAKCDHHHEDDDRHSPWTAEVLRQLG